MISDISSLDNLFNDIGKELDETITIYVFGGAALMISGLKDATKDIDVVFEKMSEVKTFTSALKRIGFETIQLTEDYKYLKIEGIYNRGNDRFDVFQKIICNNLALSKNMVIRSKSKGNYGNLSVKILSLEDIFLLKSIFSRAGDYEDCVALFQTGIDWNMIYDEVNDQCRKNPVNVWKSYLLARIEEMQEREHIQVPIRKKLHEEYDIETFPYLAIFYELFKKESSFEELLKKTELDKSLLNQVLDSLIKSRKVEKTRDSKYALKLRNLARFLSRS
ncbi:MAG: DUF6036 family nucleotidyltransferase [archaeon]